jgi:hypothetical protein
MNKWFVMCLSWLVVFLLGFGPVVSFAKESSVIPAEMNAEGWIALFNGKDTAGWEVIGPTAEWTVKDGVLENIGVGGGWLGTLATFADFDLIVEWQVSKGGNSGIFFRAGTADVPWVDGYESQIDDDDTKNPTGSIYNALMAKKVPAPDEQWNTTEVHAEGPHIIVKVNAQEVVNGKTETHQAGRIGLQMHDANTTIQFRKVWIRPLGLKSIYNGKDFTGWKVKVAKRENQPPVDVKIEEGAIRIQGGPGYIESQDEYGNFHARFKIMTYPKGSNSSGNSGVFVRGPRLEGDDFREWPKGVEAQVFNQTGDFITGGWYHYVWASALYSQDNEWFWMDLNVVGNVYQSWVNGMPAATWKDDKDRYQKGIFALQAHDTQSILFYGGAAVVEVPVHTPVKIAK